MRNFSFYNPAKIIFGQDSEKQIGTLAKKYSDKVLLVYSGDFVKELGIYQTVEEEFKKLNIEFVEIGNVVPNPKVELVREGIKLCKDNQVGFILAIGGGSSIDTAKAISVGATYDGDVWDFFEGKASITDALPIGTILTIPSSGSEMSNCSIISNGNSKVGIEDDLIIPKFSILNPKFTLSLPKYQTACGITDIYSHLLERYFTSEKYVSLTDHMIEGALKSLMINAINVMNDPSNYNYRAEVMWTSTMAHNNILDTGRESDWGSHRIEHELSAEYNITHGEGMAIVFPAWMTYVSKKYPEKFVQYASRVFALDTFSYSEEALIAEGIRRTKEFFKSLGMKTSLSEVDIDSSRFVTMAMRATNDGSGTVGHL
ncbi:MAG: iron-containing alcohol dehydrogenase, partial [Peptostreptococcaceae bacterium]